MATDLRHVVRNFDRNQEEEQTAAYAAQKSLPYINLVNYPFLADVLATIPYATAAQYRIVAFMRIGQVIRVATPDPFQTGLDQIMEELGTQHSLTFEPFICSGSSINFALDRYRTLIPAAAPQIANTANDSTTERKIANLKDLRASISSISTSELLEALIGGAIDLEASDIHFEPMAQAVHVRFRVDGKLLSVIDLPEKTYNLLASRIKTAAKIKLDQPKIAQDGRLTMSVGSNPVDIRVNTVPSAYGQTIELRLLANHSMLALDQLNLDPQTLQAIKQSISKPEGLILFTGPTGSGKTTSLYAVLQLLNTPERKIITIEDPIEYRLEGIEQVQVDPSVGFDFPQALRAVLRQDPNIIMVGEIRDKETAEIAVNAAQTGHLVLSTLHTNSAPAAFTRLIQMGVPKYLIADSVVLVVAQRLIRRLCAYCQGVGCDNCNGTGYKGRILIAEHYAPDSQTIELVKREAALGEFTQHFHSLGNKTLLQDGLEKVAQGLTTETEVRSVTE